MEFKGFNSQEFDNYVSKIAEQVTETHEKFIFETIRPYCEPIVKMEISKEYLVNALLLYKNMPKIIEEINDLQFIHTELEYNGAVKKVISKDDVLEIINKYYKESTDGSNN